MAPLFLPFSQSFVRIGNNVLNIRFERLPPRIVL